MLCDISVVLMRINSVVNKSQLSDRIYNKMSASENSEMETLQPWTTCPKLETHRERFDDIDLLFSRFSESDVPRLPTSQPDKRICRLCSVFGLRLLFL